MSEPRRRREPPCYLWVRRPRCPACGAARIVAYRSRRENDGSVTRWSRCTVCGKRLVLVVE